jgi:hypothetical protein
MVSAQDRAASSTQQVERRSERYPAVAARAVAHLHIVTNNVTLPLMNNVILPLVVLV